MSTYKTKQPQVRPAVTPRLGMVGGRLAAALIVGLLLGVPATAFANGSPEGRDGSQGVPGMSERQLRAFETQVLGPEHAAEHARQRKLARAAARSHPGVPAPRARAIRAPHPQKTGAWAKPFSLHGVIGIHALMLPTGKVMYFSYPRNPISPRNKGSANKHDNVGTTVLWNPRTRRFKSVPPPLWDNPYDGTKKKVPANIWCAGQAFLPDGRVVIVGGNLTYPQYKDQSKGFYYRGLNQVYTFNPWNEKWTRQPDMPHGRWYPSQVLMPDGRMLIVGGLSDEASPKKVYNTNKSVEVFTPSKRMDGVGKLTRLTPDRNGGATVVNGDPPDGGLYPHLFWMLSGRVLVAGPDRRDSWWMTKPGSDNKLAAVDAANPSRDRVWGTGVLLPQGPGGSHKIEELGGSLYSTAADGESRPPTKSTETFDESTNTWTKSAPLRVARSHLNTVLLPDRSMVTVGGGLGNVSGPAGQWGVSARGSERRVELFHPRTNRWTLGAVQTEARAYHSTAVLLPDARVISAGDDYNGPTTRKHRHGSGTGMNSDTAEIYSPPYLYKANGKRARRPRITRAPHGVVGYGRSFHIATKTGRRAVLAAPAAVTHANDMNQRVVPLTARRSGKGLSARMPANANIALPGYYMLFTLDRAGTPSVARWVRLGTPAPAGPRVAFRARTGFSARRGRIYGRAQDSTGVTTVEVALKARKGRRCTWFSAKARRFARRSCARPIWIGTALRPSKRRGVSVWRVSLHRRVRRGRYRLAVRAADGAGRMTTRAGRRGFAIRVKR